MGGATSCGALHGKAASLHGSLCHMSPTAVDSQRNSWPWSVGRRLLPECSVMVSVIAWLFVCLGLGLNAVSAFA